MPAYSTYKSGRRRQRGLSLVEILVGVLIGMIGIIVIFQVLMVTEQRKRTTTHGSDSQTAGAIALYTMQRELQVAGLGFGTAHTRQLGCTVHVFDAVRPTDNVDFKLVPIEITQGAGAAADGTGGAPDEIAVLWGSPSKFVTSGTEQRSWTATTPDATLFQAAVGGRAGLDWGDILVLTTSPNKAGITEASTPLTRCALVQVSARPGAVNDVEHNATWESPAPAGVTLPPPNALQATSGEPRYNKSTGWPDNLGDPSGWVLNLGKQPRRTVWQVVNGRIQFLETLANAPGSIVAEGIINMQAEYGIDTNNNNVVDDDEWTATPPNTGTLPPALDKPCTEKPAVSWACVRAIRIALLARSDQWDPTACSPNPQYTSGASGALALASFEMTNLDGTADAFAFPCGAPSSASANDWRRYRYSVYETVIPLRNMIWGTAP